MTKYGRSSREEAKKEMQKCDCAKKMNSKRGTPAYCCDDDADVAALPDNWIPRHSSSILTDYLKKRQQSHETVIKDLMDSAAAINKRIDSRVRTLADMLQTHISQNQSDIDCVIQENDSGEGNLSREARLEALTRINRLYLLRTDDMALFRRDAMALEKERTDELRLLLRDQFQKLITVAHQPPRELLHNFDERIYEINQQLLSNCRAYSDLEAQLLVQADENVVYARSALNQLCLGVGITRRGRSALPAGIREKSFQKRSLSAITERNDRTCEASEISCKYFIDDVGEFDECVTWLVQEYRNAVVKVFSGFSGKLVDLEKDLCKHNYLEKEKGLEEILDLQRLIEKTLGNLANNMPRKSSDGKIIDIPGTDTLFMHKSLWTLGESLRDTYMILHDAGHLWDAHILRSALAQKLTIAAVEDLLTNHDILELANEITFNITLEQLRTTSDIDKLQQQYDSLVTMLEKTAEMYQQHCQAELSRLEEFMNLPTAMANTILAEFECFLNKYPRSSVPMGSVSNPNPPVIGSPAGRTHVKSLLPRAILQTVLQELALRNWRNGFLESFESNVSLVPDELRRQCRLWVDERGAALHMRYSLKLISHSIRAERVKAAHAARLAELQYHDQRLDSHLDAVYGLVDSLPKDASEFLSYEAPQLYPLHKWLCKIGDDMDIVLGQEPCDPEFKRLKMLSYVPRLIKHRRLFEESLDENLECYKKQMEYRVHAARISNVRFMAQIKLMNEGGQYSAYEATRACGSLVRGADALESCMTKALEALHNRRTQILTYADQQLLPLQRTADDVLKSLGKAQDKKKPPVPGKRK